MSQQRLQSISPLLDSHLKIHRPQCNLPQRTYPLRVQFSDRAYFIKQSCGNHIPQISQ